MQALGEIGIVAVGRDEVFSELLAHFRRSGEILQADKNGLVFQTKDGQIAILELQKEGKKRMDYRSFINGNQNLLGQKLY